MAHLIHLMIWMAACALWSEVKGAVCLWYYGWLIMYYTALCWYCSFICWVIVLQSDFTTWRIEHGLWINGDAFQIVKDAIAIWFARLFPSMANEELLLMVATADYESDAFDADSDSSSNP